MMATDRRDDELIEAITFPRESPATGYAFREVARRHGDFAIVACAAIADAKGARPRRRRRRAADRARPAAARSSALDDALDEFAWSLEARDDVHASARYRRELVRRIGQDRRLEEAVRCRA